MTRFPPEYYLEPINEVGYGIFDKELNSFVRLKFTHKSAWAKSSHAKLAFANATGVRISTQERYEARKF